MKIWRWFFVGILVIGLILVRRYESDLFYDPLLTFFHQDFHHVPFPEIDIIKHFLSIALRYGINSLLSLGIIWFIFLDKKVLKFAALVLMAFLFIFLIPYYFFIYTAFEQYATAGFYVRRILIQPVMLLILVPAIWYWKKVKSDKALD